MKTIWAIIFALILSVWYFDYTTLQLENPTLVTTENNDLKVIWYNNEPYLMTDRDLQEFYNQKIKQELHDKYLYSLTK